MNILVIDDQRTFAFPDHHSVTYARNSSEAIGLLENTAYDEVWFDHDLGLRLNDIDTIWPVVEFLEESNENDRRIEIDSIVIHTANPVGREGLRVALSRVYEKVTVIPSDVVITLLRH